MNVRLRMKSSALFYDCNQPHPLWFWQALWWITFWRSPTVSRIRHKKPTMAVRPSPHPSSSFLQHVLPHFVLLLLTEASPNDLVWMCWICFVDAVVPWGVSVARVNPDITYPTTSPST